MSRKNKKVDLNQLKKDIAHLRCKLNNCCGSLDIDSLTEEELIELRNRLENINNGQLVVSANQIPDPFIPGDTEILPGSWPIRVLGDQGEETNITIISNPDPYRTEEYTLQGDFDYSVFADANFSEPSIGRYYVQWDFNGYATSNRYFGGDFTNIEEGFPFGSILRHSANEPSTITISKVSGFFINSEGNPLNINYTNTSGQNIYYQATAGTTGGVLNVNSSQQRLTTFFNLSPQTSFSFYADLRQAPSGTQYQVQISDIDNPLFAYPVLILSAGQIYTGIPLPGFTTIAYSVNNLQISVTQI